MRNVFARLVAALFVVVFVAAACGDDDVSTNTIAVEPTADAQVLPERTPTAEDMSAAAVVEVPDAMPVPTIAIEVVADAVSGANLSVQLTDFVIAPEHASTDPVDGEGHMHVYVDGERIARFYNQAFHLPIGPGEHEVRVELSANNHSPYAVDGKPIEASATVTVPDPMPHMHHDPIELAGTAPDLGVEITPDPKSGWNLQVHTGDFRLAPDAVNGAPVEGEGHLHVFVDGEKVARLYGEWLHIDGLALGPHVVTVELTANDHSPYAAGAKPVTATATIDQAAADSSDARSGDGHDHEPTPSDHSDVVIDVIYRAGSVEVAEDRQDISLGDTVEIRITSDVAEELHVHGYDAFVDLEADQPASVMFPADIPGLFEVELEGSHQFVLELQVR